MGRLSFIIFALSILVCSTFTLSYADPGMAGMPALNERVFAEWQPNSWRHGTITGLEGDKYFVNSDNGDRKLCSRQEIVTDRAPSRNEIAVNTSVLSKWTDGNFYPGRIGAISDAGYSVLFDDGGRIEWVAIEDVRIR